MTAVAWAVWLIGGAIIGLGVGTAANAADRGRTDLVIVTALANGIFFFGWAQLITLVQ